MTEDVRITDISIGDDGYFRFTFITDSGSHTIELDREDAMRFVRELFNASFET